MRFVIFLLALLVAVPAYADWQNTKWGMTEQQIRSVMKGAETPSRQKMEDARIEGRGSPTLQSPYLAGDFLFNAYFYFGGPISGLSMVSLDLTDLKRCSDLVGSLRLRYGTPAHESRTRVLEFWVWRTDRDQVSLRAIGTTMSPSTCTLSYQPRQTNQTRGL